MAASDASRPRPRKGPFFTLIILFVLLPVFLTLVPNPLTDLAVSRACAAALGRPVELRGVRYEFQTKPYMIFRVREIDLRPVWQGEDSAVGRFVHKHGLESGLLVKDSLWAFKRTDGGWYARLLEARAGEVSIKGGLRIVGGRISKWNAIFWLPRAVWGRFPELVEKRFAQDGQGRRLFKLTWNDGRWRLWGRSGPVLEARWQ